MSEWSDYNTSYSDEDGTFRKHKLKDKKMIERKGYHLSHSYELEET